MPTDVGKDIIIEDFLTLMSNHGLMKSGTSIWATLTLTDKQCIERILFLFRQQTYQPDERGVIVA